MVNEHNCGAIAITSLLIDCYPQIASRIMAVCKLCNVEFSIIDNANDYWCRDFMPIQISNRNFVQFTFDPSYYKHPKYEHLKTIIGDLNFKLKGDVNFLNIVLDGGNICYYNNVAIISDKVFKDNEHYQKEELKGELIEILQLKNLIIIPSLPNDITGHADGMIRFVNDNIIG